MTTRENNMIRWWDLSSAALLLVAILTAASRLVATRWTDHLEIVQAIAVLAVIAGLALGKSRFSHRFVLLFAIIYGIFVIFWQIGSLYARGILWTERVSSIFGRLGVIIWQIIYQQPVNDSLLFIFLMASLFWFAGSQAGYNLVREGNGWQAILITGVTLFVIHSFDPLIPRRVWYLVIFIFFALVLVARTTYLHRFAGWQNSRTSLPPHLSLDFIRTTLIAAAILVALAWTIPALANTLPSAERAFQRIKEPYNQLRDRFDSAFVSLRASVGVVSDYYGSSMALGRGNALAESQVLVASGPNDLPANTRLYWRARVYDRYENGQWLSTYSQVESFDPMNDVFNTQTAFASISTPFNITSATDQSTLLSPAQPVWISRPALLSYSTNPDETSDIAALRANPTLRAGENYIAQASLSNATVAQLRSAGTVYPEWVTNRYLQLPDSITDRTRTLAQRITAGQESPYDQAVAITSWLRNNIQYTETIPELPTQQDPIDWFIFDLKQGFCNYYATAEVIMLRSVGIPARWSTGFAQGEKINANTFLVRQRDAHSWPEVYFPIYGWIEFEPTAAQPELLRLPGDVDTENPLTSQNQSQFLEDLRRQQEEEMRDLREAARLDSLNQPLTPVQRAVNVATYVLPVLLLVGALIAFWLFFLPPVPVVLVYLFSRMGIQPSPTLENWASNASTKAGKKIRFPEIPIAIEKTMLRLGLRPPAFLVRLAHIALLPPISKAYLEINSSLHRIGNPPKPTDTPQERAQVLGEMIPPAVDPAQKLVTEYQLGLFSNQSGDLETARSASKTIHLLSMRAMLRRWLARLQEPERLRFRTTKKHAKS